MAKKILFLDDNGFIAVQTLTLLKQDGYDVESCARIDQANQYLKKEFEKIGCIITDLNMNDEWLNEYQCESDGGRLSGWVWLRRFVYDNKKYKNIPSIIFSGFIGYLEHYLEDRDESDLLRDSHIHCIPKGGGYGSGYNALVEELKNIIS